jgi:hypothetical protein
MRFRSTTVAATVGCLAISISLAACSVLPPTPPVLPLPAGAREAAQRYVVVTVANDSRGIEPHAAGTARGYDGSVTYQAGASTRQVAHSIASQYGLREVSAWPIRLLGVHCLVYELAPTADRDRTLAQLQGDRRVDSAQALEAFETRAVGYNDPYAALQANLTQMDVPGAQQFSTGAHVRIAIIDTGIDAAHPDLAGRLVATRDFVDGEHGYAAEMHGTEVAGVIGALANNGIGIAGIAPDAELIGLRACWSGGVDGHGICNSFTLAQAITAALDARASIINLSLSGPDDPLLTRLVERGQRQGAIFVGAVPLAGNRQGFPTGLAHVLAVDRLEHPSAATGVLLAPGTDVFTLSPQGHYDVASGSSIAAAEVSGVAALLLSVQPGLPADRLEGILSTTSQTAAGTTRGAGGIDAGAAIKKLRQRLSVARDDGSTAAGK